MAQEYRERIPVPVWWWLLGGVLVVSIVVAVWAYTTDVAGLVTFVLASALVAAALLAWTGPLVRTDQDALSVGRARIQWRYLAGATPLDAAQTARRLGPDADPDAYLAQRPFVPTAVEVSLADPADPHPYWLVSTRRPEELAAAINERATGVPGPAEGPR